MREIPDGEALLLGLKNRVSREAKLAFISTFAFGLVMHLYMIVNKIPNHDDIIGLFIDNDSKVYGRWFLYFPSMLSTNFSIPWITGLFALLWLSLAAVCVVRMLRVRRTGVILTICAVMASFPTVYYTLCYLFTADAYMFALLLAVLGAFLTDRYRFGFLLGGLMIGLSLATYQAYVFCAVALMAIRMLCFLLFEPELNGRRIVVKLVQYLAALLLGAVVYKLGLMALVKNGVVLKTYMGLDSLGSLSVRDLLSRIPTAYGGYFSFFSGTTELLPGRLYARLFAFCNLVAILLTVVAILRGKGRPARGVSALLSVLILAALPLLVNGIQLVSAAGLHLLMQYSVVMIFLLPATLYDGVSDMPQTGVESKWRLAFRGPVRVLLGYALSLCLAACAFLWTMDANQTYLALELKFDNMMSLATRMVDRVEQLPEYVPDETPVWYTGTLKDGHYGAVKNDVFARASATDMTGREWNYTTLMNNLYFYHFVNNYIGVQFVAPEDADAYAAMETDAYKEMPYFPEAGSVRCINGIIIINGGPNPQSPP